MLNSILDPSISKVAPMRKIEIIVAVYYEGKPFYEHATTMRGALHAEWRRPDVIMRRATAADISNWTRLNETLKASPSRPNFVQITLQ